MHYSLQRPPFVKISS